MANIVSRERRLQMLAALVDGNSECAVARMIDINTRTISRFALALGRGAERLHDRLVRDLSPRLIEIDEIWSYVGKKQARVMADDPPWLGEAYTFVGLDATSRLCIAYQVGKRDQSTADAFVADLRARLLVMPQLMTSDGFVPYIAAIETSFGPACTYAQVVKNYRCGGLRDDDHRYEPPRDPFLTKRAIYGTPDLERAATSHVERNNGTMRHHIGRIRRLCYAFSKRIENHRAAVALGYAWYNFGTIVKTLRVTPAMATGITDHVWEFGEFMDTVLAEPEGERPQPKPLRHELPTGPARELPNGRGFLRLLPGSQSTSSTGPPTATTSSASPSFAPRQSSSETAAPSLTIPTAPPEPPKPQEPIQLSLFDILQPPDGGT